MIAALSLSLLVAATPPAPQGRGPEVYALVVGYNGATAGLPTLRYADDDAVRLAMFFRGISDAAHVVLLTRLDDDTRERLQRAGLELPASKAPTRDNLFAALKELADAMRARTSSERETAFYFVYAGHGLKGRFLLEPTSGGEAGLTGRELRAAVGELPADRAALFLDACRSQSLFVERGEESGPDLSAQVEELERRTAAVKIGVLTAATSDKPAGEASDLKAGYFSHVLASGLAGAADADGDERVTFGELAAFVAFNTQRLTGQRPWFDPPGGDLHATAMDLRGSGTRLVLPAAGVGRFLIGSRVGSPVFAEVNKGSGRPLALALPPGSYRVVRVVDDAHGRAGLLELAAGERPELQEASLSSDVALGAGQRGEDLDYDSTRSGFSAPFNDDVVATLSAGYQSGREPTALAARWRHSLGAGYGIAPGPLSLGGLEQGIDLEYRLSLGRFLLGARGDLRQSSHLVDGGDFQLRRTGLFLEGGLRLIAAQRVELSAFVGSGFRTFLRADGSGKLTSAEPFAPAVMGGASLEYDLGLGLAVHLEARYELALVRLDGQRQAFGGPLAGLGLSFRR